MIEKDITLQSSVSDDFDSLLDDFIHDNLPSTEEESRVCSYRGHDYLVPAGGGGNPPYLLREACFEYGDKAGSLLAGCPHLYLPAGAGLCPVLSLRLKVDRSSVRTPFVRVCLFREGRSSAWTEELAKPDADGNLSLDFPLHDEQLLPGRCFVLLGGVGRPMDMEVETLGGYCRLPFRLLLSGEGMEHPVVARAKVCRAVTSADEADGVPGVLRLVLELAKPAVAESELCVICRSESGVPMGQASHYFAKGCGRRKLINFALQSSVPWQPATYVAELLHNGTPYALASFHYIGEPVTVCKYSLLPRGRGKVVADFSEAAAGMVPAGDAGFEHQPDDGCRQDECVALLKFEGGMEKLNAMVGLDSLKGELTDVFLTTRFGEQRRRFGLPMDDDCPHHMIFTGNPGTGKSTVARLIGEIFHSMGMLSKGEVIATERAQLLGRYIGETEENMRSLLDRAHGNVLFIDEAYTLCDSLEDRKDFGNHVIESLLTVLAEPRPDMLVILAGYADEMERLMQVNPGLKGRFPHRFHFDDYDAPQLIEIARRLLERKRYELTAEASARLSGIVEEALERKDRYFSNARWMSQLLLSGVLPAMARRVMGGGLELTAELLCRVEAEDVEAGAKKYLPCPSAIRRRIGFAA